MQAQNWGTGGCRSGGAGGGSVDFVVANFGKGFMRGGGGVDFSVAYFSKGFMRGWRAWGGGGGRRF